MPPATERRVYNLPINLLGRIRPRDAEKRWDEEICSVCHPSFCPFCGEPIP